MKFNFVKWLWKTWYKLLVTGSCRDEFPPRLWWFKLAWVTKLIHYNIFHFQKQRFLTLMKSNNYDKTSHYAWKLWSSRPKKSTWKWYSLTPATSFRRNWNMCFFYKHYKAFGFDETFFVNNEFKIWKKLLRIQNPLQPACLTGNAERFDPEDEVTCSVSGWGDTDADRRRIQYAETLQIANVKLQSFQVFHIYNHIIS